MHYYPKRNTHGFDAMILDEEANAETPGFVSDYQKWFGSVAAELNPDATGIGSNDHRAAPYALPELLHPTRWTGDEAVKFLEKYEGQSPFLLFDLRQDSAETRDLSSREEYRATLALWRRRLIDHLTERGEPFVVRGDLGLRPEPILYSPNYPADALPKP
jgi:hypothetical protein